jgi:hypothetical protein
VKFVLLFAAFCFAPRAARAAAGEFSTACAAPHWAEAGPAAVFENDVYGALKDYLNRARATLALGAPSLDGFGVLADSEAAKIPGTLKSQGLAFDGASPVFSWRYGLQRADEGYRPLLTRALAIPPDILAAHYDASKKNGFSHIGDIDIAGGRLYAPIEDEDNRTKPFVAIFDPKTLRYTGEKHLLPVGKLPHGVPWIAVDAPRGVLYTMDWDSQDLQVFDLKTFRFARTVPLKDADAAGRLITRVQGGKVRGGLLYVPSDSNEEAPRREGAKLKRKRLYVIDPIRGSAREIAHFDEPERAEVEGLAFGPDGTLHVLVLAPYFYDGRFPPEMEINDDDWNPSARLLGFKPIPCE